MIHKQRTLEDFEVIHDIVAFMQEQDYTSQSAFCNWVLGGRTIGEYSGCEICEWSDVCDTIPSGEMGESLQKKYAEYLI